MTAGKDGELERLAKMTPLARAKAAAALMDDHRQAIAHLATVRAAALRELREQGMSVLNIAEALGISRQQVHRLLREAGTDDDVDSTMAVREVAGALGVSPRRVYELIDEGRLPALKRGRELRLERRDVDEAVGAV